MNRSQIDCVRIYPLRIPLKTAIRHAASAREFSDSIVVEVELADGTRGYGETLPRPYVTGETVESVPKAIESVFVPALLEWRPSRFPDALERAGELPMVDESGVGITAARAAVELAALDAYSRHFQRPMSDVAGWFGMAGMGAPGCISRVRCSGVITADSPEKAASRAKKMSWYGLRDFKVKVGFEGDDAVLAAVCQALARPIRKGKATVRIDANGAWSLDEAAEALNRWTAIGLTLVEQPLSRADDGRLQELRKRTRIPLMHDESLVTMDDAERLTIARVMDWMNVRISKVGGLLAALKLAGFAQVLSVRVLLGCMVGETSILSAAARRFLEMVPNVELVEGNFGQFQLSEDVTAKSLRFGYGGRLTPLAGLGWGIDVDLARIKALAAGEPVVIHL